MNFKGWWRTQDGSRCEPLTVRDAHSRYVLSITSLTGTTGKQVRAELTRFFPTHGLPKAVHRDNGSPFISTRARGGFPELSVWLATLSIRIVRSRPGCPQDNGGHERMHRDIAQDVQRWPREDLRAQQRELDRWRQEFDHVRPHEALGGKTPSEVYRASDRKLRDPRPFAYPPTYRAPCRPCGARQLARRALLRRAGVSRPAGRLRAVAGTALASLVPRHRPGDHRAAARVVRPGSLRAHQDAPPKRIKKNNKRSSEAAA